VVDLWTRAHTRSLLRPKADLPFKLSPLGLRCEQAGRHPQLAGKQEGARSIELWGGKMIRREDFAERDEALAAAGLSA
jgi:hypothetical protein